MKPKRFFHESTQPKRRDPWADPYRPFFRQFEEGE